MQKKGCPDILDTRFQDQYPNPVHSHLHCILLTLVVFMLTVAAGDLHLEKTDTAAFEQSLCSKNPQQYSRRYSTRLGPPATGKMFVDVCGNVAVFVVWAVVFYRCKHW